MQQLETSPRTNAESRRLIDDIHFYVGIFRRGWKLIAIGVAIGLTLAAIHLARSTTLYRASARLLLIQQSGRPLNGPGGGDPFRGAQDGGDSLATHLMLMRSPVIVEQAIRAGGLDGASTSAVIEGLTAKQPDPTAKIVELTYRSPSRAEAAKIIDGVMKSYNNFLRENFQKNTGDIISLIVKARDELSRELTSLEQQYLDHRQRNPAYSADESGRSFIARRLDQWDQSMNQVLARTLQLKSQLELGRKLAGEGLDQDTIANALNQLGGLGGVAAIVPQATGGGRASSGQSVEKLREEIADVESQRLGAELLLAHLRREMAELATNATASDREIAEAFYADPVVAKLQDEVRQRQSKLHTSQRISRYADDPAIVGAQRQIKQLEGEIQRLWEQQRPALVAHLAGESSAELAAAVRKAEFDLINLKAKKAALGEQLGRLTPKELQRLRRERERIARAPGGDRSQIRQVEQQIARLERGADDPTDATWETERGDVLLGSIARSLEAIEAMRADLQEKFDEDLTSSKKAEIGQLGEANLRSNLERHRTLFNSVVDQLKQAQLVSDFGSVSARTINPTSVAAERPKYLSVFALAVLGGCGAGMLGAYFVELLDARVRTVAEMRELLGMPVLGMIPQLCPEQIGPTGRVGLLSHELPRSVLAESYKSARTNLEFLRRNRRAQVLLVSSPQPGDGKSTTASNLAITLAHAGRRVLLIDGDLRKPSQHHIYTMAEGLGFSDAIAGAGTIGQYARPTFIENLDLLVAGSEAPNPAELLAASHLGEVLDGVRETYDIVIIDSSPLLAVTDPSIIAAVVDGIVLVVRVARTRRYDVGRTKDLLETMGLPVLGVVINGILSNQLEYGYGHGYGYGYGGRGGATSPPHAVAAEDPAAMRLVDLQSPNGHLEWDQKSPAAS